MVNQLLVAIALLAASPVHRDTVELPSGFELTVEVERDHTWGWNVLNQWSFKHGWLRKIDPGSPTVSHFGFQHPNEAWQIARDFAKIGLDKRNHPTD